MNLTENLFENIPVRIIQGKTERRMSAVDVCRALGYLEPRKAWYNLKERNQELKDISVILNLGTVEQNITKKRDTDVINLKGVMLVCMLAKTEKAVKFRDWASDVLVEKIAPIELNEDNYLEHLQKAIDIANKEKALRIQYENKLGEIEPVYQDFLDDKGSYDLNFVAKTLGDGKLGRNKLFAILRKEKIFYKDNDRNLPFQNYIDKGYFVMRYANYKKGKDKIGYAQALVTTIGMKWISNFLEQRGYEGMYENIFS